MSTGLYVDPDTGKNISTKVCPECGETKPLTGFYRSTRQGWQRHCKPCKAHRIRLRRYGLTQEEFQALVDKYQGKCHSCKAAVGTEIDHDHTTGEVRGMLCQPCNMLIGWLERLPGDGIERVKEYLGR